MAHGKGQLLFKNGTIIEGDFKHGLPCGNISKN